MKGIRLGVIGIAVAMMASSCTSTYQASAGLNGAWIGGNIGEAVGLLSGGHFRGHNAALGRLIGMGAGAALGVSIASQIEKNEQKHYEEARAGRREQTRSSNEGYSSSSDYQTGGGAYADTNTDYYAGAANAVSVSGLGYTDTNGDGYISKGEVCEIECYITNNTSSIQENVIISLTSRNSKDYSLSPSLTTTLSPGQRIRYTGRVMCKKARSNQQLSVALTVNHAEGTTNSKSVLIPVKP